MTSVARDVGRRSWLESNEEIYNSEERSGDGSLTEADIEQRFKLTFVQRVVVGGGHIFNDLCASLWFSYFLLYFENVAGLSPDHSAILMLIGQVVDAIATPLVGYEADKQEGCAFCHRRYGRCKSWHFYGTIFVVISFPFIFNTCIGCGDADDWAKLLYYAPFITIFQIGWAATQISHLALIAKVNPDELVRTELLAIRYGFTVFSNVLVFILAWQMLGLGDSISETDAGSFRNVAIIAIAIGLVCSSIFHFCVREHKDEHVKQYGALLERRARGGRSRSVSPILPGSDIRGREYRDNQTDTEALLPHEVDDIEPQETEPCVSVNHGSRIERQDCDVDIRRDSKIFSLSTRCLSLGRERMRTIDWLTLPQFYIVALIYMATRLCVNVTQVYIPLYLQNSLQLEKFTVATVPLTMYIFGFLIAIFIKLINKHAGRQLAYILGAAFSIGGAACIMFLDLADQDGLNKYKIYAVAALLGSGASALLVTSLAITADLIGNNVENGAFVYGAMSFTDKLSCGLAVMGINAVVPCKKVGTSFLLTGCHASTGHLMGDFYRKVIVASSGGGALLGVFGIICLTFILYLRRFKVTSRSQQANFDEQESHRT